MGLEIFGIMLIILFAALLIVGTILLVITRNPNNAGARCNGNGDCTGGTVCESSSHTCRIPLGGTCETNAQCATGSACASNICVRVVSAEPPEPTTVDLKASSTTSRSIKPKTQNVRFNITRDVSEQPPRLIKFGRSLNETRINKVSPLELRSPTPNLVEPTNVNMGKDTMVRGEDLVKARSNWRAQPITSVNENKWKAQPIQPSTVESNWRAQQHPIVTENKWKARPTKIQPTKLTERNLIDLDFDTDSSDVLVPKKELDLTIFETETEPVLLTQTEKLRSQFVEEIPDRGVMMPVHSANKKMEIIGQVLGQEADIEVPVNYEYKNETDEEELFGTFRSSSVRGVTISSEGRPVLDICHFSSYIIYIHEGGYATRETITKDTTMETEKVSVKMNIQPILLAKHRGNLYGLQNGSLYVLDIGTLTSTIWKWVPCTWSPLNIHNITSTSDGKNLYLQTQQHNILYDSNLKEVSRTEQQGKIRVYGYDVTTYIDIDRTTNTGVLHVGSKQDMLMDVVDAVILHNGKVVTINTSETSIYRRVRLIQWRPWYIKV